MRPKQLVEPCRILWGPETLMQLDIIRIVLQNMASVCRKRQPTQWAQPWDELPGDFDHCGHCLAASFPPLSPRARIGRHSFGIGWPQASPAEPAMKSSYKLQQRYGSRSRSHAKWCTMMQNDSEWCKYWKINNFRNHRMHNCSLALETLCAKP